VSPPDRHGVPLAEQPTATAGTELRELLQRLLLAAPQPVDGETLGIAVCLLLEQLDVPVV
jgi:hypothetical protein